MEQVITALIDGDTIPYIVAYNNRDNDEPAMVALEIDQFVNNILTNTGAREYFGFVQVPRQTSTLRKNIATTKVYKGNRTVVPDWYEKWGVYIKNYLIERWNFTPVYYIESDDAISIMANILSKNDRTINYVVCSSDKDLDQIPGNHYNTKTTERYYVDPDKASACYWRQALMGDSTDNITGIPKVGPKTAEKILEGTFEERPHRVLAAYIEHFGPTLGSQKFGETCQLIGLLHYVPEGIQEYVKTDFNQLQAVTYDLGTTVKRTFEQPE